MKALVVYDSAYGNTARVAQAIGAALGSQVEVATLRADEVQPAQWAGVDLLVVGSPTQGFRPTKAVSTLLAAAPRGALKGMRVAAFDTRLAPGDIEKVRILAFLVRIFGFAAEKIAAKLRRLGGVLAAPPEGFIVGGKEGPLQSGELERAATWAAHLVATPEPAR